MSDAFFADFLDVEGGSLFHDAVETIARARVVAGCGAGNFCLGQQVTRAQMASFWCGPGSAANLAAPAASGQVFADVPAEVSRPERSSSWRAEGHGGLRRWAFCAASSVTRAQMAVFLLKTLEGSGYVPPPAQGVFDDVPAADPFAPWIEELTARGISAGCGGGHFCPAAATTRGQMAAFLARTFFAP